MRLAHNLIKESESIMLDINSSAYPVLSGDVAKNRDADTNARFVTLKASEAVKRAAKCVEIPSLNLDAMKVAINSNGKVLAMAVGLFEDYQSKMIQADIAKGKDTIFATHISLDSMVLNYESDVSSGGRISKDKIIAWFDNALAISLINAFSNKLGIGSNPTEQETKKLNKVIGDYKANFALLAGRDVSIDTDVKSKLQQAIKLANAELPLTGKLIDIINDANNLEALIGL